MLMQGESDECIVQKIHQDDRVVKGYFRQISNKLQIPLEELRDVLAGRECDMDAAAD